MTLMSKPDAESDLSQTILATRAVMVEPRAVYFGRAQRTASCPLSGSSLQVLLAWFVGIGACLVLVMATLAFGPSGFGFGCVIAFIVFAMMARRYRFSLRTFLIATTVFGVWLGLKVGYDLRLQRAITAVTSAGGTLKFCDRSPSFPWGLWADRYVLDFSSLREPLIGEQLAHLEAFAPSSLRNLYLENAGITDENASLLERFTGLESLSVGNRTYLSGGLIPGGPKNRITDACVAELRSLNKLIGIDLCGTDVTDECLKTLAQMHELHWIKLDGTKITGEGIAQLGALKYLNTLDLNGCPISTDGYQELGRLPNVSCIGLSHTGMRDTDLKELNEMPQLTNLLLWKVDISDEALQQFINAHPQCRIQRLQK